MNIRMNSRIEPRTTCLFPVRSAWAALLAAATLLGIGLPARAANADFLDAVQAFVLSPRAPDAHSVEVRFDIAPGYYLYREKLAFEAAPGVLVAAPQLPPGHVKFDTNFNKQVETYRDVLKVPLAVGAVNAPFALKVTSQGCADKGLCYPPLVRHLRVDVVGGNVVAVRNITPDEAQALEAAAATVAPAAAPATSITKSPAAPSAEIPGGETARIERALQSGNLLLIAGVFVLAGLLLSFTPCVLPMVPILSSIIVGQGGPVSRTRGFSLALAYCLGMALVYTGFGVVAGLLGEGLAAALQNPWVLGAFALLLAALSLAMFGLYQLQMPSFIQERVTQASGRMRGGNFAGVFAMGGLSALIVGPCVAAPLAGALVYISQTRDVLIGGVALFALACGMSAPLLLVGLSAGSLLPRAGAWMESVKHVFGVMLLAVAIWLVAPVLPAAALMGLVGALLLITAVYLHAFDRLPEGRGGWPRFFKGVGVLLALVGAAQFVGALSGGRDALQPLAHLASRANAGGALQAGAAEPRSAFKRVSTVAELEAAVKAAGKPVLLDFYADWCVSCKEYEKFTFADPAVRAKLADFELLQADVTANNAQDRALLKRFNLFGPPGIVFFDGQGREQAAARVVGYQPAKEFLGSLMAVAAVTSIAGGTP
jgi:thiol:disulfide interchange protein DsbD